MARDVGSTELTDGVERELSALVARLRTFSADRFAARAATTRARAATRAGTDTIRAGTDTTRAATTGAGTDTTRADATRARADATRARADATRADVVRHLADRLAATAAAAERVDPGLPPRLGDWALADQLAVLGRDLVVALRAVPDDRAATDALAELALHRADLDGAQPGPRTTALLAAGLGVPDDPERVLTAAAARCAEGTPTGPAGRRD